MLAHAAAGADLVVNDGLAVNDLEGALDGAALAAHRAERALVRKTVRHPDAGGAHLQGRVGGEHARLARGDARGAVAHHARRRHGIDHRRSRGAAVPLAGEDDRVHRAGGDALAAAGAAGEEGLLVHGAGGAVHERRRRRGAVACLAPAASEQTPQQDVAARNGIVAAHCRPPSSRVSGGGGKTMVAFPEKYGDVWSSDAATAWHCTQLTRWA